MIEIPIRIKPEVLVSWAKSISNECKKQRTCDGCVFYDNDNKYPVCVLIVRTPEDWNLEHLS